MVLVGRLADWERRVWCGENGESMSSVKTDEMDSWINAYGQLTILLLNNSRIRQLVLASLNRVGFNGQFITHKV